MESPVSPSERLSPMLFGISQIRSAKANDLSLTMFSFILNYPFSILNLIIGSAQLPDSHKPPAPLLREHAQRAHPLSRTGVTAWVSERTTIKRPLPYMEDSLYLDAGSFNIF